MNSKQLFFALHHNSVTREYFDGIFASDQLNDIIIKPRLIIVNTHPSEMKGEHWLAFFFEGIQVDIFDSLSRDVNSYTKGGNDLLNFVQRFAQTSNMIAKRLQPPGTNICGQMCLYFAYYRCLGYSLNSIVEKMQNTKKVLQFIDKHFTISPEHCFFVQNCSVFE